MQGQRLVVRLFLSLGQAEQRVESLRQVLSLLPTFTPASAFPRLSPPRPLSPRDFLDFLDSLDLYATEEEAQLVIQQYDCDRDGCLSCADFEQMTLPATSPSVRGLALARSSGLYTEEIETVLAQLIALELAYHRQLIAAIREIAALKHFDLRTAFETVAVRGVITRDSLRDALQGLDGCEEETLDAVFRRLDWNGDEKLSFEEFAAPFAYCRQAESPRIYLNDSASPLSLPRDTSKSLSISARSLRSSVSSRSLPTRKALYALPSPHLELLLAYFQDKLVFLRQAEVTRLQLALDPNFSLEDTYHLFDPCDKGYLTVWDLEEGLRSLAVEAAAGEVTLLIQEYATAGRKLCFSDFCDMILPFSVGKYGSSARGPIKPPTSDYLTDLFQLLITTERRLESHRQAFARLPSFSLCDIFKSLDLHHTSHLSLSDLRDFLEYHSVRTGESELTALLASLDRDKDGQVTMKEFAEALTARS